MPSSPNQKMKLLYLMKILLERTDTDNILTMQEIIIALADYDIQAERKSLYTDMELLRQFGLSIESRKSKTVGYYIDARDFELPELKLLVDAVQSSRFITAKKSEELIKKLSSLASIHQSKQLKRQVYVADRPKTVNESIYYNIDAIHTAINDQKKISFRYFDYDISKSRVYRKKGTPYCQTPVALCWSDDNYYFICYSFKYDAFTHYRVDRMCDVTVCEEDADKFDRKRFNIAEHAKQTFGMFSGEIVRAILRFDQSLVNVILDRFGKDITLYRKDSCFEISVDVSTSPVFLGWIFQFGSKAKIISPDTLQQAMKSMVEENREIYCD